jgi:hypothetical protein
MALSQQRIANLLDGRMPLRLQQRRPNECALRSFLEVLLCEKLLKLFTLFSSLPDYTL